MAHLGIAPAQLRNGQARIVDADALNANLVTLVDGGDLTVSGLLYGIALVPAQKLDQQIIQQLRACANDDLLRVHLHGTKLPEIPGDGHTQLRCAVIGGGTQQLLILLQNGLAHEPGPNGKGEIGRVHGPGGKIQKPGPGIGGEIGAISGEIW